MLSRVADSLYWMNRYLERAEHTARLLGVKHDSLVEQTSVDADSAWRRVLGGLEIDEELFPEIDAHAITQYLALDREFGSSIFGCVRTARDNARQVREEISSESWEHLNRTYLRLQPVTIEQILQTGASAFFREFIDALHLYEGLANSTIRHGEGYRFLELGRFIERAVLMCRLLDCYFGRMPEGWASGLPRPVYADWLVLLRSCTAFEAYSKVYTADVRPERVAEFLIFDPEFPHSVRFAVDRVSDTLARIAPDAPPARRAACARIAGRLKASVDFGNVEEVLDGDVDGFLRGIAGGCEAIHTAVYEAFIDYGSDSVVAA